MHLKITCVLLFVLYIESTYAGGSQAESSPGKTDFLIFGYYNECEGKNAANYTHIEQFARDAACSLESGKAVSTFDALVQGSDKSQTAVNSLQVLAQSLYPAGAYTQLESLFLVTGGPLEGKYVYIKQIYLDPSYMKKCSSILGYSYVTSKSATLLINEKLDLNVLLSPTGAFEVFKKGCTTVCNGKSYIV